MLHAFSLIAKPVACPGHLPYFSCIWCFLFGTLVGIMDSEAKCWQESMLGGSSIRNKLFSWWKLFGGKSDILNNNNYSLKKVNGICPHLARLAVGMIETWLK